MCLKRTIWLKASDGRVGKISKDRAEVETI